MPRLPAKMRFSARRSHTKKQAELKPTFQLFHGVVVEDIVDQAHSLVHVKFALFISLGRHNSRTLLTSVNGMQFVQK
jgi:hypothetical protein